ncbi:MAG: hypothetical protein M1370_02425 [Bacteroidetes bacterium]|nr:hypothetical protein [Bacteroidota bacterium]
MTLSVQNRTLILLLAILCVVAALALLLRPTPTSALPSYAAATGQACGTCHVDPAGGGPRNDVGQAFEAIPTHSTDPAGAWAQISGAPAPAPVPPSEEATPTPASSDVDQAINDKFNNVDTNLKLWAIQPGLGTVMIEYATRFANLWFAAQAGNWDMATYQIDEMTEIQEVGETTRPARAPFLKAFEDTYLKPLDAAADAKDLTAFTAAYDRAISGCNACHASQPGGAERPNFKFIKIKRPTAPVFPNVDWKGQ